MANKEKMGPPTLEMIQGNPYNYTFDEVAKCMGEERAKSLFKTLYKNGVSPKNQTMTIKVWGDRIFEKCGIRRDEGGDGGKTLEIRGKRRLSARDGGANYQQS